MLIQRFCTVLYLPLRKIFFYPQVFIKDFVKIFVFIILFSIEDNQAEQVRGL